MSDQKLFYIVRADDMIQFKTSLEPDYLENKYGFITKCIVKDADLKSCDNCNVNELKNIKQGEIWVCLSSCYFCNECYPNIKSRLELYIEQKQNLQKKIPHKLNDVIKEIEQHNQYNKLDVIIKFQYEASKDNNNKDNNKYMRDLWYHLYHGKDMPIG